MTEHVFKYQELCDDPCTKGVREKAAEIGVDIGNERDVVCWMIGVSYVLAGVAVAAEGGDPTKLTEQQLFAMARDILDDLKFQAKLIATAVPNEEDEG